jgi:hypothetical protein
MSRDLSGAAAETPQTLTPKEFLEREETLSAISQRERALNFLLYAYAGLLVATMVIIFLQGFKLGGFELNPHRR